VKLCHPVRRNTDRDDGVLAATQIIHVSTLFGDSARSLVTSTMTSILLDVWSLAPTCPSQELVHGDGFAASPSRYEICAHKKVQT
jgi:hypothetical protein